MKHILFFCVLFFGLSSALVKADATITKARVMPLIEKAYIRASIPGTSISSAYMNIENKSDKTITLESVTSNISPRIEIHQHSMVDGLMRMRKVNFLEINSKERVKLQPSGLHLMIFDVKKPLTPEQKIELTLHFSNNVMVTKTIPVYSLAKEQSEKNAKQTMHDHHH